MSRSLFSPLLLSLLVVPAAAQAEGLALRYDVFAGGSFAVAMEAEVQMAPTAYRMGAALELGGMYAVFASWDMQTSVSGAFAGDLVLPVQFNRQAEGGRRWVEIQFADGSVASARGNPSPDEEDNSMVPAAVQAAAIDPLSAIVAVLRQVGETGSCAGSSTVYDGKRYFAISRVDGGPQHAPATRYGAYSGPALLCRVTIDEGAYYQRADRTQRTADIWLAQPIAGSLHVPVRIETESKYGAVRVHLTDMWSVSGPTAVAP